MKKLLTLLAFITILSFGCAAHQPDEEKPVPPMPKFNDTRNVVEVVKEAIFACMDTPQVPAGQVMWFQTISEEGEVQRFALWVFEKTSDMILVQYSGIDTAEAWYDYGRDLVPEYYFSTLDDIPGGNDICKGLELLRKK